MSKQPIILIDSYKQGLDYHNCIEKYLKNKSNDNDFNKEIIMPLLEQPLFKDLLNYEYYSEVPYFKIINGIYESKRIDFMAIKKNDIYIIDYKTDNQEDERYFIDNYSLQILEYKSDLSFLIDKNKLKINKVYCYIYAKKINKMIQID